MKTKHLLRSLVISLCAVTVLVAITPSPPFQGRVTIGISVPGALNPTNRFLVIGSADISVPMTNWQVLTNVAGNVTNFVVFTPIVQEYFLSAVETNQNGIGPFAEPAWLQLPRQLGIAIRQAQ